MGSVLRKLVVMIVLAAAAIGQVEGAAPAPAPAPAAAMECAEGAQCCEGSEAICQDWGWIGCFFEEPTAWACCLDPLEPEYYGYCIWACDEEELGECW